LVRFHFKKVVGRLDYSAGLTSKPQMVLWHTSWLAKTMMFDYK